MDIYEQIHKQNKRNLEIELCLPKETIDKVYSKAMSEVNKDTNEFYPFAVYRRARNELKK